MAGRAAKNSLLERPPVDLRGAVVGRSANLAQPSDLRVVPVDHRLADAQRRQLAGQVGGSSRHTQPPSYGLCCSQPGCASRPRSTSATRPESGAGKRHRRLPPRCSVNSGSPRRTVAPVWRQIDALDLSQRLAREVVDPDAHLPRGLDARPGMSGGEEGPARDAELVGRAPSRASAGATTRTCGSRCASRRACAFQQEPAGKGAAARRR